MIAHEPGPNNVICWQTQLSAGGKLYTFVALHVAGSGWYTSALNQWQPVNWPQLREFIGESPAWVATAWQALPHDQYPHTTAALEGSAIETGGPEPETGPYA